MRWLFLTNLIQIWFKSDLNLKLISSLNEVWILNHIIDAFMIHLMEGIRKMAPIWCDIFWLPFWTNVFMRAIRLSFLPSLIHVWFKSDSVNHFLTSYAARGHFGLAFSWSRASHQETQIVEVHLKLSENSKIFKVVQRSFFQSSNYSTPLKRI